MGNVLADQQNAQASAVALFAVPDAPACPSSAQGMDSTFFQMGVSDAQRVWNDLNTGNAADCATAMQVGRNNVNNIQDPPTAAALAGYLDQAQAAWDSQTPAQEAANQSNFNNTTAQLVAANQAVSQDPTVIQRQDGEITDITNAQKAQAAGKDPALAYLGVPDTVGIGTALNLSGQSPRPGVSGLTGGGLLALGGTTLVLVGLMLAVVFVYAKGSR